MNKLREKFLNAWKTWGIGKIPSQEYRFSPTRQFRFDFAWPDAMLAVELDGFGGGHQTHFKFSRDHEKDNHAVELGWTVLRYTHRQLGSKAKQEAACKQILNVLKMQRKRYGVQPRKMAELHSMSTSQDTQQSRPVSGGTTRPRRVHR